MPADSNIFQQYLQPPKSVMDYTAAYDQADARKNALEQSVLSLKKGQLDMSNALDVNRQRNALRDAVTSGQLDLSNPEHVAKALSLAPDVAPAMLKTIQEGATARAKAGLDNAQAGHATAQTGQVTAETQSKLVGHLGDAISSLQNMPGVTPAHVATTLQNAGKLYGIPDAMVQQAVQQIPADPTQLKSFLAAKNAELMTAKERMAYIAPDANTVANNQTSTANNAATNATHIQTTGMTNATSRANNSATINAENLRAGVMPGGGMDENAERTAQAIASGQLLPPSGMALLNPKNQRILGRVMEINPQYDATTVTAKKAAATAFTTGKEGAMMRSLQVSSQHLDQLGQLADAMNNGNMQLVNKIGNIVSQQTGSPAVTNFDGAKEIVAKEVMKSIVAGGGGVNEREELARSLSNAKSPAQLKGVIQQYRNLMAAQHEALLQQRDAAGLPRSTLPNYTEGGSAAPAPGGMPSTSAIDAELARRAGKK